MVPVSQRPRQSPYPLVPVKTALSTVLAHCHTLTQHTLTLHAALGSVLNEKVIASQPLPSWPASIKDGYAVVSADGPGERRVLPGATAGDKVSNYYISLHTVVLLKCLNLSSPA